MVSLIELWLPILVSAVGVFIVSSALHMCLPIHKNDYQKLDREDEVLESLRNLGLRQGEYMFPNACSMKDAGSTEMVEKFNRGPVGIMTVFPNGQMNIGKCLGQWFALSIVISLLSGYCGSMAFGTDATGMNVFRMVFIVALTGYGVSSAQNSIWKGQRWPVTGKFLIDATLYALTTASVFAWLWPGV
jgi:hypothetical protein